ncbi:MAG: hypothetical protein H6551_11835 [Chitinophagales bacterium]|nr:hypothetical protein [Chitinophagaceae bacterium]MCB9065819.1 hypothetical protein [Chitinophagales bacterium]
MQATLNYTIATEATKAPAQAIIRKEAVQKILMFAGILVCIALAVHI